MNTDEQSQAAQEGLPWSSWHDPGSQLGCALDRVQKKAVTPGSPTLQTLPSSAAQASPETQPPAGQHLGVPCVPLPCCLSDCYGVPMQAPWCRGREQLCFPTTVLQRRQRLLPNHRTGPGTLSQWYEQGRELMR